MVLADRLRALTPKPDVSAVMGEIDALLDESIIGHAIKAPIRAPDDLTGLFDLRAIRFRQTLSRVPPRPAETRAQLLRAQVEAKLTDMVRRNPTRADMLESSSR